MGGVVKAVTKIVKAPIKAVASLLGGGGGGGDSVTVNNNTTTPAASSAASTGTTAPANPVPKAVPPAVTGATESVKADELTKVAAERKASLRKRRRRPTILTSPTGLESTAPVLRKSLLGA